MPAAAAKAASASGSPSAAKPDCSSPPHPPTAGTRGSFPSARLSTSFPATGESWTRLSPPASRVVARVGRGPALCGRALRHLFGASNRKADLKGGGKAFYDSNDIHGAVRKAIDDSRVTCVVGYHPSHNQWDGEWPEIKVKVGRPATERDRKTALQEALWSTLEATSIGLTVNVRAVSQPQPDSLRVTIGIDSRNVNLEEQDGRWTGKLDLLFVQQGGTAQKVSALHDTLDLKLNPEAYRTVVQKGICLAKNIQRLAGAAELRLVVRDASTGAVGSLTIPLKNIP